MSYKIKQSKRKMIYAQWKDWDGYTHDGVYFKKDKPQLEKKLKIWKEDGRIKSYSFKEQDGYV